MLGQESRFPQDTRHSPLLSLGPTPETPQIFLVEALGFLRCCLPLAPGQSASRAQNGHWLLHTRK